MLNIDWKTLLLSTIILGITEIGLRVAFSLLGFCSLVGSQVNEYGVKCISVAEDTSSVTLFGIAVSIIWYVLPLLLGYFIGALFYFRKSVANTDSEIIPLLIVFGIMGTIAGILEGFGNHVLKNQPIVGQDANTNFTILIFAYSISFIVTCIVGIFFSLCGGLIAYRISKPQYTYPQGGKPIPP